MNRLQKLCLLGVFSLETMSFHEATQAQITPYLGKPHQIRPDLYRKQNDGTILETKTGDIYDMKGNLLKPATQFRSPNASSSSTSQLTPERIREYANEPGYVTKLWRASTCYDGRSKAVEIDGHRLSNSEMDILFEELKC
jgi:hypothetical protein